MTELSPTPAGFSESRHRHPDDKSCRDAACAAASQGWLGATTLNSRREARVLSRRTRHVGASLAWRI
jgi:hypothetical protein